MKKTNNQIETTEQLFIVIEAITEYYRCNACTTTSNQIDKSLTVSQLLLGATEMATIELKEFKNKEVQ